MGQEHIERRMCYGHAIEDEATDCPVCSPQFRPPMNHGDMLLIRSLEEYVWARVWQFLDDEVLSTRIQGEVAAAASKAAANKLRFFLEP